MRRCVYGAGDVTVYNTCTRRGDETFRPRLFRRFARPFVGVPVLPVSCGIISRGRPQIRPSTQVFHVYAVRRVRRRRRVFQSRPRAISFLDDDVTVFREIRLRRVNTVGRGTCLTCETPRETFRRAKEVECRQTSVCAETCRITIRTVLNTINRTADHRQEHIII